MLPYDLSRVTVVQEDHAKTMPPTSRTVTIMPNMGHFPTVTGPPALRIPVASAIILGWLSELDDEPNFKARVFRLLKFVCQDCEIEVPEIRGLIGVDHGGRGFERGSGRAVLATARLGSAGRAV
jgi:hypothetical protein